VKLILRRRLRSALRGFTIPETYESAAFEDERERERLAAVAASASHPLRLHIGCGPRLLAGWINIDLAYQHSDEPLQTDAGPEFAAPSGDVEDAAAREGREDVAARGTRDDFFAIDVTRGLPLPDRCVEVIFHEDFIEHLNQRDAVGFLAEAHRVLCDGGVHRVNSPDLAASMRDHSHFERGLAGTYTGEWDRWHHRNVFTPRYLEEVARMVGYSRLEFNQRNASVSPLIAPELRPSPGDRPEDGNLFADLLK